MIHTAVLLDPTTSYRSRCLLPEIYEVSYMNRNKTFLPIYIRGYVPSSPVVRLNRPTAHLKAWLYCGVVYSWSSSRKRHFSDQFRSDVWASPLSVSVPTWPLQLLGRPCRPPWPCRPSWRRAAVSLSLLPISSRLFWPPFPFSAAWRAPLFGVGRSSVCRSESAGYAKNQASLRCTYSWVIVV